MVTTLLFSLVIHLAIQASKHLHVLAKVGLVNVEVDANRRIYSLCPDPLVDMNEWLDSFIKIKEEQFDRFEVLLKKVEKEN